MVKKQKVNKKEKKEKSNKFIEVIIKINSIKNDVSNNNGIFNDKLNKIIKKLV